GARDQRLLNNLRLEVLREMTPPPRPSNHFQPANLRRLRLKRMVKHRHKPISKQRSAQSAISNPNERWDHHSAYLRGAGDRNSSRRPDQTEFARLRWPPVPVAPDR